MTVLILGVSSMLAAKELPIQNEGCGNCILITVEGHGVKEGKEGKYYFPSGYTLRDFWADQPVKLFHPDERIRIRRFIDGNEVRYVISVKEFEGRKNWDGFPLRNGDELYISQPII